MNANVERTTIRKVYLRLLSLTGFTISRMRIRSGWSGARGSSLRTSE